MRKPKRSLMLQYVCIKTILLLNIISTRIASHAVLNCRKYLQTNIPCVGRNCSRRHF